MSNNLIPKRAPEDRHPISTEFPKPTQDPLSDARKAGNKRAAASLQIRKEKGAARQLYYTQAVEFLKNAQPSSAVEKIRTLPMALMEMFLVAEMENLNRPEVLMYFPKPGSQAREVWLGPVTPKQKRPAKKAEVAQIEEAV